MFGIFNKYPLSGKSKPLLKQSPWECFETFVCGCEHAGGGGLHGTCTLRPLKHVTRFLLFFGEWRTAFCTYSMGFHDTLRHCQRARACRCGGEKSRALRQGRVFQLFVQMALWDTLGSGKDKHFAPELFAGTSKTTTFYKVLAVIAYHSENAWKTMFFEHVANFI